MIILNNDALCSFHKFLYMQQTILQTGCNYVVLERLEGRYFNRCSTVHFDKYEIFFVQQMHYLLKHEILHFVFKCLNVHFSNPTCFGPLGPSSGSIHQNLAKVTKITVF
jgi:hypothetical protein